MTVRVRVRQVSHIAGSLTLGCVGTLIIWPYTSCGRSRRGSPKAGTIVEQKLSCGYRDIERHLSPTD